MKATENGVYMLMNEEFEILYIGSSKDVSKRIKCHKDKKWAKFTFIPCINRETAYMIEGFLISMWKPKYNKTESTKQARYTMFDVVQRVDLLTKLTRELHHKIIE